MNLRIIFLCVTLFFTGIQAHAQLTRKEKKEWKKKAKEFAKNPANLKSFVEKNQVVVNNNKELSDSVIALNSELNTKSTKLTELEDQLTKAQTELTANKAELAQLKEHSFSMNFSKGVFFKVQIGAFRYKNLSKYFKNNPNFGGEATEKGEQRFTIGVFRDYWAADEFKKYMRAMGVRDAWIVPFRDGQRVELKDVLEGVLVDKDK